MVQFSFCLLCILPRFPPMWQYDFDVWPPTLKKHYASFLTMLINCSRLYVPGAYDSFCILPTTFPTKWQYYLDLWPATLQNNRHFLSSRWSNVRSCKILKLMVRPKRLEQIDGHTDGRRYIIIRPVKEGV